MVFDTFALLQLIRVAMSRTMASAPRGVGLATLLVATVWHGGAIGTNHVVIAAVSPLPASWPASLSPSAASGEPALVALMPAVDARPLWRTVFGPSRISGARVNAGDSAMQIRCPVYGTSITGEVPPGSPVTVRVSAEDGSAAVMGRTIAEADGGFRVDLGDRRITPGDIIEVDLRATIEDPVMARVPSLTARTDADREAITGEAPAGALVVVTIDGNPARREVVADGAGLYVADFSRDINIEPPMRGRVELATPGGLAFVLHWTPLQTHTSLGSDRIWGNGPAGRHVAVAVRNASGVLLGAGATYVDEPPESLPGSWFLELRDVTGASTPLEPGDTVGVRVGDDSVTFTVPPLDGAVHATTDVVTGSTEAGLPVGVTVRQMTGTARRDVVADAAGFFTTTFGNELDLTYNTVVSLQVMISRQRVAQLAVSPGLILDLDAGSLCGMADPGSAVAVMSRRGSMVGPTSHTVASDAGTFMISPQASDGECEPLAGDIIEARVSVGGEALVLLLPVPELTVTADTESDVVSGRAPPGGDLWVSTIPIFERPTRPTASAIYRWSAHQEITADGNYFMQLGVHDAFDVVPGYHLVARYTYPSGHVVLARHRIPIVSLQSGGSAVCGHAASDAAILAELRDATGMRVAVGRAQADDVGRYTFDLLDGDGVEVTVTQGMPIHVSLGASVVEFRVPPLHVETAWNGVLRGMTTPDTDIARTTIRSGGCFAGARGPIGEKDGLDTASFTSDASGSFSWLVQPSAPGEGFELAVATSGGQRVYRQILRGLAEVHVFTDKVTGQASPHTHVAVTLTETGGRPRGEGHCRASSQGLYECHIVDSVGQPVAATPGDQVHLRASDEAQNIDVEMIDFDFDQAVGVLGVAPPGRKVQLRLLLTEGRERNIALITDEHGAFTFSEPDIPVRADWTLADIASLHAALATLAGHWIVRESDVPQEEVSTTIYAPLVVSGR